VNRRKALKQAKLRDYQYRSLMARYEDLLLPDAFDPWILTPEDVRRHVLVDMENESPYMTMAQDRHERRVFGHSVLDCPGKGCTLDKIEAAVAWNQPPSRWAGGGRKYRRRVKRRKRR
jgi:hypothetical protein